WLGGFECCTNSEGTGGECYFVFTQVCCGGSCYNTETQGCCNGQIYNLETEQCCQGFATTTVCSKTRACCPSGECCNLYNCQGCNPESGTCDDMCLECSDCINNECVSCYAQGKVCCDGWCTVPCEEEEDDETSCSSANNSSCTKCVGLLGNCSSTTKIYTNAVTYDCDGGCFGDCHDVQGPACYEIYACKNGITYTLAECTSLQETGPVPLDCYPTTDWWQCTTCVPNYEELMDTSYAPDRRCETGPEL
ncbi:MAG: hypothetical protein JW947_01385, partial [Sedimentisphaerales bacterium]|nr:hypothetical protein [Sedimentisphaerales bacterium]